LKVDVTKESLVDLLLKNYGETESVSLQMFSCNPSGQSNQKSNVKTAFVIFKHLE
jgi:hypothetical protein